MKKWIIGVVIVIFFSIISIYLFIPSKLSVSSVSGLRSTATGSFRTLSEKDKWINWLPDAADTGNYTITSRLVNTLHVSIHRDQETINSTVYLIPIAADSTIIEWKCEIPTSNNPFSRIQRYQKAVAIKEDMVEILRRLRAFVEKPANVYGFDIQRTTFTDTLLMTTKTTLSHYPSVPETYQLIAALKSHIAEVNAAPTGDPMQNVTPLDSNKFQVMVALPVNKVLNDAKNFQFRRMIPGSFMKAEVKGGPQTIKEALHQMQLYFFDHRQTAMAIPFEYLITDRTAEPDTSKWITRIYAPVY